MTLSVKRKKTHENTVHNTMTLCVCVCVLVVCLLNKHFLSTYFVQSPGNIKMTKAQFLAASGELPDISILPQS